MANQGERVSTQQTSENTAAGEQTGGVDGLAVLRWFDQVFPELLNTSWGPLLKHGDVDIFESLRCELFYSTMAMLRRNYAAKPTPGFVRRAAEAALMWAHLQKMAAEDRQAAANSAPLEQVDILFWPCEPTHIKAMRPVIRWLADEGVSHRAFACKPRIHAELIAQSIPTISPVAYWNGEMLTARKQGLRRGTELVAATEIDVSQLTPFGDTRALVENLRAESEALFPLVYRAQCNAENIMKQIRPRLLVVGNDFTYEGRVGVQIAKAAGVATACPMHGVVANNPLHSSHISDKYLAYGDSSRRHLLEIGLADEKIAVVGAPYLDDQPKQSGQIDSTIQKRLKLDEQKPYVLAANSGPGNTISHEHHDRVLEAMCRASAALPQMQFVAKLHRKDRGEFYEKAVANLPEARLQYIQHGADGYPMNIFNWLQGCTVLLTGASSVAVEAMLMGVPVITMDYANEITGADFVDSGTTTHVTDAEGLIEALRALVESPEQRAQALERSQAYLQDMFLSVDGNSARRAGEELCRLAGLG